MLLFSTGVLLFILSYACLETDPISPVPEITFTNIELGIIYDSKLNQDILAATLEFEFKDGDADFGTYEEIAKDSTLPDSIKYNLFLIDYYKLDSIYYLIEHDTNNPPLNYTIFHDPKLDRVGQNKTVKGNITLTIIDLPVYDTIKFDFYIRDRAGNKSNIESTSDLGTSF
jgi:hypothetical protein